jgi:hypothetical protein
MYHIFKRLRPFIFAGLLLILAACSTGPAPQQPSDAFVSVASVEIAADATQAEIEKEFGGTAFIFKPEAGFAILGFKEGQLTTLNTTTNIGNYASPEVSASGRNAWAAGRNAWGGGLNAWAGGKNAWAGGFGDIAPGENNTAWDQINLREAHAISRKFGQGIKVAVIDSGVDLNHPVFSGNLTPSSEWKDFVDNDSYPMDVSGGDGYGHGTAVASIILQVAPKATILPIRVLNATGVGDTDNVALAIDWAVQKGAHIINISLGSREWDNALFSMAGYANSRGIMIFASSGNYGGNETMTYPGGFSWQGGSVHGKTLGIGSITSSNTLSSFTSYGYNLYGVAPGEGIAAAYPGNQMAGVTGTSFAAPLFTGAGALALSEMSTTTNRATLTDYFWNSINHSFANSLGIGGARLLDVEKLIRILPGWTEPVYQVVSVNSNKCLDVANGSLSDGGNVYQWVCHGGNNQRWKFIPEGTSYKITNVNSGKALDVSGASSSDGANIHQWGFFGGNNQKWNLVSNGDGSFTVRAVHSSKCLDVAGVSKADGANVHQWSCYSGNSQKWRIQLVN